MKDDLYDRARNKVQLAAYFAREMIQELGRDRALDIIGRAYEKYSGDTFAEPYRDVPLEERFARFKEDMKAKAERDGHFTVVGESDRHLEVRFSRCPYYEVYADFGIPEVCRKYCDADFTAFPNIHPKLRVERSHEIAYGDDYCDHRWYLEE